jgi:hypothetical protein
MMGSVRVPKGGYLWAIARRHVNVALRILDELVNGFLTSRELTQVLAKEDHCSPFKYGQDDCQKV